MKYNSIAFLSAVIFVIGCTTPKDTLLNTQALVQSPIYNDSEARSTITNRILTDNYEGYNIKFSPSLLQDSTIAPKSLIDSTGTIIIHSKEWASYSLKLKQLLVDSIIANTWGSPEREFPPLYVTFGDGSSPLSLFNSNTTWLYGRFSRPEFLKEAKVAMPMGLIVGTHQYPT